MRWETPRRSGDPATVGRQQSVAQRRRSGEVMHAVAAQIADALVAQSGEAPFPHEGPGLLLADLDGARRPSTAKTRCQIVHARSGCAGIEFHDVLLALEVLHSPYRRHELDCPECIWNVAETLRPCSGKGMSCGPVPLTWEFLARLTRSDEQIVHAETSSVACSNTRAGIRKWAPK